MMVFIQMELRGCQTATVCSCWLWQRVQEVNRFLEWYLSFNPLCHIPQLHKGVIQERNLHVLFVWPSWYHVWVRFSYRKTDNPGEMEGNRKKSAKSHLCLDVTKASIIGRQTSSIRKRTSLITYTTSICTCHMTVTWSPHAHNGEAQIQGSVRVCACETKP